MIIPFAKTNFRNKESVFGIQTDDRRRHMYVVGKTGTGKTTLLRNMMVSDIMAGHGIAVVDPHGEFAEDILDYIPEHRIKDVIYFDPSDLDFPIAFNAVEKVDIRQRHLVSSGLIGIFKKIWADSWGPRLEYVLRNAILALLEQPDSTLLGVMRILSDKDYRKQIVENLTDPMVKQFWIEEFGKYSSKFAVEAVAPIQNKVGQFLTNPMIRNIFGQKKSAINMRKIMDEKKILIVNLSKGKVGEDSSALMGAMLITKIQQAAMSRIDTPEDKRSDFYLYIDEFQNFATDSFAGILSEARKYRLDLILAHQYVSQLKDEVRDAVFGNAGTLITFRIGADDAELFEKEFSPEITSLDLVNLANYKIYLKLMIDGIASKAFSADTLAPIAKPSTSYKEEIINLSRERYGSSRSDVEQMIADWSEPIKPTPGSGDSASQAKKDVDMHDAICAMCEITTSVPFVPDSNRPVFCKECLPNKDKYKPKKLLAPAKPTAQSSASNMSIISKNPIKNEDLKITPEQKITPSEHKLSTQIENKPNFSIKNNNSHKNNSFQHKIIKSSEKIFNKNEQKERKKPDLEGLRRILAGSLKNMENEAKAQSQNPIRSVSIKSENIVTKKGENKIINTITSTNSKEISSPQVNATIPTHSEQVKLPPKEPVQIETDFSKKHGISLEDIAQF